MAGKTSIPGFIDDTADVDSNVVVNIQRNNLSAMDVARYLQSRLPKYEGSRSKIAARIGKSAAYVTQHLALLDLPPAIQALYDKRVCRSATTLYELARLHKRNAPAVENAIAGETEIGGEFLARLSDAIKREVEFRPKDHADSSTQSSLESAGLLRQQLSEAQARIAELEKADNATVETQSPTTRKQPRSRKEPTDQTEASHSVRILVVHKGKRYELDGQFSTARKPSAPGRVWIRKGRDKPVQVDVEGLQLDTIIVKS